MSQEKAPKYQLLFYRAIYEFVGALKLYKHGKLIAKWTARSGQPENSTYWVTGNSPIPASNSIIGSYAVQPGYIPGSISAMGNWYYHIIPDPIRQKDGSGIRSEIGIHEDANFATSPGTAGCIGIDPSDWKEFRTIIDAIFRQEGPGYVIPLTVIYGNVSEFGGDAEEKDIFEKALKFTLKWEGGFSDNAADYGGRTMEGITQYIYNLYRAKNKLTYRDVKLILDEEVKDIYKNQYWNAAHCDEMEKPLDIVHFDTVVNFGVIGGGMFLQEALGFSGYQVDGIIGPKTLAAMKKSNPRSLANKIIEGRIAYRHQRCREDKSQEIFLQGWLNRDNDLKKFIE